MSGQRWRLLVEKDRIDRTEIERLDEPGLHEGEVEVALRRFALTANNVTYAVLGRSFGSFADMPGYWAFFPTGAENRGQLPVWGFAEVTASRRDGLSPGERLFGFFPLASHLTMRPTRITTSSFVDATEHRAALPGLYNDYTRVSALPGFREGEADLWPVFRPLLATGFLIGDQLIDDDYNDAEQIVIGSASSKTAMMTAQCLGAHDSRPRLVGLTSGKNVAFVRETGLYDESIGYDDLETIPNDVPTAFIDMAGDGSVTERVHRHFADKLKLSLMVGLSHWDARRASRALPGAKVVPFFAPGRIKKRAQDWGGTGLAKRIGQAWKDFTERADTLTELQVNRGAAEAERAYHAALRGDIDPRVATIIDLA